MEMPFAIHPLGITTVQVRTHTCRPRRAKALKVIILIFDRTFHGCKETRVTDAKANRTPRKICQGKN